MSSGHNLFPLPPLQLPLPLLLLLLLLPLLLVLLLPLPLLILLLLLVPLESLALEADESLTLGAEMIVDLRSGN